MITRYHYLTDRDGRLVRVNPLTGLGNLWLYARERWSAPIGYHNISAGLAPLVPFHGPLQAQFHYGEVAY